MAGSKDVAHQYLEAFKKGDLGKVRSLLADNGSFGHAGMSADAFVDSLKKGPAWQDVHLIHEVHTDDSGALLYEGTNASTGQRMQASEFLKVSGGKIENIRGAVIGAGASLPQTGSFSSFAVMAEAI
jgi:ketosteroid isomerase-like protein